MYTIDKMPFSYETQTTSAVRLRHQVWSLPESCADISASLEVSFRPVQKSQLLQNLTIL